ncbi:MAG: hypothetical protein H6Q90_933 [Deltaproteobacteria bacterium]|nr:hypothetical protein [Deltaproteobacteria bacterium]
MKFLRLTQYSLLALALTSSAACSKKQASCDNVFEHIKSLTPEGMRDMLEQGKAGALAKCEAMSSEQRQCALDAKTIEELQACKKL